MGSAGSQSAGRTTYPGGTATVRLSHTVSPTVGAGSCTRRPAISAPRSVAVIGGSAARDGQTPDEGEWRSRCRSPAALGPHPPPAGPAPVPPSAAPPSAQLEDGRRDSRYPP